MSVEKALIVMADLFFGRLPDEIIKDVKDYANFREWEVAFNTLCEQLYEFDVTISEEEWHTI